METLFSEAARQSLYRARGRDWGTHFNESVTAIRHGADVPQPDVQVTLDQLHALSLRRLLAAYETKSASPADYEQFVHVHAAIFLALHEEQAAARFMKSSATEQS